MDHHESDEQDQRKQVRQDSGAAGWKPSLSARQEPRSPNAAEPRFPVDGAIRESEAPAELSAVYLAKPIPTSPPAAESVSSPTSTVRKHPAHGVLVVPNQTTIVFCTVCTKGRKRWLASWRVVNCLIEVWREATIWKVGRFVVMPDHIHLFASPITEQVDFDHWMRYWKSRFTKQHGNPDHRWQTDHWDTRMRNAVQYEEKWEYVRWNPVRYGLVGTPGEWPYQGEVFELRWD